MGNEIKNCGMKGKYFAGDVNKMLQCYGLV
jgi:hypothetical protein